MPSEKSKCDGHLPCQRCLADDQICVFSERKRSKDKVYPKGYVELLESRTQTLADALHKVLYCQQQHMDISHIIPRSGKIVINEVLGQLDSLKGVPEMVNSERYTDDLLENFMNSERNRQTSFYSDSHSRTSLDCSSSGELSLPATPPETFSPTFNFDGQYLSQPAKAPYYDQLSNLPTSIAPSMLMPDFTFGSSPVGLETDFTISEEQMFRAEPSWY